MHIRGTKPTESKRQTIPGCVFGRSQVAEPRRGFKIIKDLRLLDLAKGALLVELPQSPKSSILEDLVWMILLEPPENSPISCSGSTSRSVSFYSPDQ